MLQNKMKILILCDKKHWMHKMSRVRFHAMDAISRHYRIEAIKDGPNFPGWKNVQTSVTRYKPDFIFWYKPMEMPGYDKVKVPKIIAYNEMWHIENTTEEITKSKSDIVICHHQNDIRAYRREFFLVSIHCCHRQYKYHQRTENSDQS